MEQKFRRHIHETYGYYTVSLPPQLTRELDTKLVDIVVNDSGIHLVAVKEPST